MNTVNSSLDLQDQRRLEAESKTYKFVDSMLNAASQITLLAELLNVGDVKNIKIEKLLSILKEKFEEGKSPDLKRHFDALDEVYFSKIRQTSQNEEEGEKNVQALLSMTKNELVEDLKKSESSMWEDYKEKNSKIMKHTSEIRDKENEVEARELMGEQMEDVRKKVSELVEFTKEHLPNKEERKKQTKSAVAELLGEAFGDAAKKN